MRRLSLTMLFILAVLMQNSDSPHGSNLKYTCSDCHNTESWEVDINNMIFSHNATRFKLEGVHQELTCRTCHSTLVFSEAKRECMSCHTDIHEQTVGLECSRCHSQNSWLVDNITELHELSRFPLLGPHTVSTCDECHLSASLLLFEPRGIECYDCHQNNYISARDPDHVAAGYSTDCQECHKINSFSWRGEDFIHDFFPLTLGHEINDCRKCHTSGYENTSPQCFSCHESDFNTTSDLNHNELNLPTDCMICHTTNPGWKPASFPIHSDYYILTGAHAVIAPDCNACHKGDYQNTPNTCYGCHEDVYNQTNNPPHASAQFSTDCIICHNETSWIPSTFDHDGQYFPIYSGKHSGEWNTCTDCHTTPGDYSLFSCIDCHEHNKTKMDDKHSDVNDYVYSSIACFDCHPIGEEKSIKIKFHNKIR